MAKKHLSSDTLDTLDEITTNIAQAQAVLSGLRADFSPCGGALTPNVVRDLLWTAESLLDRAFGASARLSTANVKV